MMLLDVEETEPVTRREPLSKRREPELLGAVLGGVLIEIFRRRRLEIAERDLEADQWSHCGEPSD
jgi:hypothetical protein